MKEIKQAEQWEEKLEEFLNDKYSYYVGVFDEEGGIDIDRLKQFIQSLLQQQRKSQLKEIKEMVENKRLSKKDAIKYNTNNQAIDKILKELNKMESKE